MSDSSIPKFEPHALANIFPALDGAPFSELVEDIRTNGLHEPIMLFEGAILDGRNRYRVCIVAAVEPRFETFSGGDPLAYVISLNLKRRHLAESQRAMVAARIANLEHGQRQTGQLAAVPTQEQAAAMLNVGGRTVRRAREVIDEGVPELVEAVDRNVVSVSLAEQVARMPKEDQRQILASFDRRTIIDVCHRVRAADMEANRVTRLERIGAIAKRNNALDTSIRYPVILADPPWQYENPQMGGSQRAVPYPTMPLADICALPVSDLATDDAILYLWAKAPKLMECGRVIEAWGFDYRTCFVWIKDKIGMGYFARNQHELLLVARRGNIPAPAAADRVSSVIEAPRGEHSVKPNEAYQLIEKSYPTLPKIESRRRRAGWTAWGNEAEIEDGREGTGAP